MDQRSNTRTQAAVTRNKGVAQPRIRAILCKSWRKGSVPDMVGMALGNFNLV